MNALSAAMARGHAPDTARPLRILTFLAQLQEPGGVERAALRLHRAWRAQGLDAKLVMGAHGGRDEARVAGTEARGARPEATPARRGKRCG
jgi:hypothetical protein